MGVPDRPSQGKHGSAGGAGGQGQPGDGVPPIKRYIPASETASPLPPCPRWRRRRRRTPRSFWDSLPPPRDFHPAPPQTPNAFPSVVDLSAAVFSDEPFKKPKRRP